LGSQTCIPLLGESAKKKTLDDLKWSKLLQIFKNSKLQNLPITESFK
jgi:hypothetical protein